MLPSKFEANPTLHLRVRCASFSLLPLASLYSNDYSCEYAVTVFSLTGWFSQIQSHIFSLYTLKFQHCAHLLAIPFMPMQDKYIISLSFN